MKLKKEKNPVQGEGKGKKLRQWLKKKWVKRTLIAVIIIFVLSLMLRGCMGGAGAGAMAGTYLPATVEYQDMMVYISGTGTVEPNRAQRVIPAAQGEILEVFIKQGQTVKKGDVLFSIDPSDYESTVRQAELALQQAEVSYNQMLKDCTFKAGAAGVVTKLYVEQGDTVSMGTPIAEILDRDNMELTVPFHSADCTRFYPGQTATVTVDGSLEVLTGTVHSVSAADVVGAGGALVRNVTVRVPNPGAMTNTMMGSVTINGISCAANSTFVYAGQAQVVAKTSGEVQSLSVREGDRVAKNQILGQVVATDMEAQVEGARLGVENARLSLERALDQLEEYTVTADFDGVVAEENIEPGNVLDPKATQYPAVIYDLSELRFVMTIDELDISAIHAGQPVEFSADALDGRSFTGVVDSVSINGTTVNGKTTYPVTVVVDDAPAELYPGMNVSAKIIVKEVGKALCIPVDYVSRGDVVKVALPGCLDDQGNVVDLTKMEERQVVLGSSNEEYIEILEGLAEGDVVLRENRASSVMEMMMGV